MKISWTPTARKTYFKVLDYLEKEWTAREIQNFAEEVEHVFEQMKENPKMFKVSKNIKNVRKGFITKHNSIIYNL